MFKLSRRHSGLALLVLGLYLLLRSSGQESSQDAIAVDAIDRILDSKLSEYMREVRTAKGHLMLANTTALESKQKALACFVDQGTWLPGNEASSFNGPVFQPNDSCLGNIDIPHDPARDLCSAISSQKVLLVGSEATHHLHTLWLDALAEDHACLGPEFCTFHHICLPPGMRRAAARAEPRFKKLPRDQDLADLGSALVRFALSSALRVPDGPRAYGEVRVEAATGVRVRESNWVEQARRSQVVVMNRGPVPAPATTYNVSDESGALERWEVPWAGVLASAGGEGYSVRFDGRLSRVDKLVGVAMDRTLRFWLPEVVETLALMREDEVISKNALIWHGAWYKQLRCATGRPSSSNVLSEVLSPSLDPWTLYHNLQGMAFPYERLSFAPDVDTRNDTAPHGVVPSEVAGVSARQKRWDCMRYPDSSPGGRAMQVMFIRGMRLLL
ncbi:hypothetical protein HDZ31DRAFT_34755 [Schizophyllum fasciatum]